MAQQSERTSSGLRPPGDPGLLQSRPQRDQDMSDCSTPASTKVDLIPTRLAAGIKRAAAWFSHNFHKVLKVKLGPGAQQAGKVTCDSFSQPFLSLWLLFRAVFRVRVHFFPSDLADCQQHLCAPCCVRHASNSSSHTKNLNRGEL